MRATRLCNSALSFVVCLALSISPSVEACDACQFVASDPSDCKVYGQLGDGVLIGWSKASQECLDFHNIKIESIDPASLALIFPNPDGSGGNVNAFVNFLKFNEGAAANGIKLSFTDFFQEGTTPGTAVLKDTIVVNGQTYDCKASASDCWNKGLKTYFSQEPGASEMQSVGVDLYNRQKLDRELEQSTVRIAICNEGSDASCEPLATEIATKKQETSKACSAFGLGPANNPIPGCPNSSKLGSTNSGPAYSSTLGSTSSGPALHKKRLGSMLLALTTFVIGQFAV